ncbi:hypothetical protein V5O48_007428 [Marasmius crinis-equi]|uniref:Uncharacterized protein n=1 Tax=Marasmius crinis-equi TaxID=585013 RepID=A0ABR3FHB0_9AGAR
MFPPRICDSPGTTSAFPHPFASTDPEPSNISSTPNVRQAPQPTSPNSASPSYVCHPPKSAIPPGFKPVARTPSTRSKRTPPLGPSPLRIVTLPEMSISEFGALSPRITSPTVNPLEIVEDVSGIARQTGIYPSIGLGYPSSWGERFRSSTGISTNSKKERGESPIGNRHGSQAAQDEAEGVMLEIIRDLVEETSGWDSSLHMEDNFKSLIQNAGITPQNSREHLRSGDFSLLDELNKTASVASPVEIDLGLLELDPYRMQCMLDAEITESRFLEHGMPLTTLEEEDGEELEDVDDGR